MWNMFCARSPGLFGPLPSCACIFSHSSAVQRFRVPWACSTTQIVDRLCHQQHMHLHTMNAPHYGVHTVKCNGRLRHIFNIAPVRHGFLCLWPRNIPVSCIASHLWQPLVHIIVPHGRQYYANPTARFVSRHSRSYAVVRYIKETYTCNDRSLLFVMSMCDCLASGVDR